MKRLTPDLPPAVNHRFEISPQTADKMWSEGRPVPLLRHNKYADLLEPRNALRSADGRWLIRHMKPSPPIREAGFNAHDVAEQGAAEFAHLQDQGIAVITHAITPSIDGQAIFTVTPWLAGLKACPDPIFESQVPRRVGQYYRQAIGRSLVLNINELNRPSQYSLLPAAPDIALLHDVDPYLIPIS